MLSSVQDVGVQSLFDHAGRGVTSAAAGTPNPLATAEAGQQALLVLAYLRKSEIDADLAVGFGIGTTTVFRYVREALSVLGPMPSTLDRAVEIARRAAFVNVDGMLLRIDRVGMVSGRDRLYYSGKFKRHGVNVQVVADPAGRLIWTSPTLPGARHDMGRDHGLLDALAAAGVQVIADGAYRGAGPPVEVPQRHRAKGPDLPPEDRTCGLCGLV